MTDENENNDAEGETVETQGNQKKFTQEDLNKFLSKEKKSWQTKFDTLQTDFNTLQATVAEKERVEEENNKTIVEGLKKDLPKPVLTLLEKLSVSEQLEYLQNPENVLTVEKKKIPETPEKSGNETPKYNFGTLI